MLMITDEIYSFTTIITFTIYCIHSTYEYINKIC